MSFSTSSPRMEVKEALAQLRDHTLMVAAAIAYNHGNIHPKCEDCAAMIGDAIRSLMREQR